MRLVVTGAAGLTGAEIVRELVRRGHSVIGVTRRRASVSRMSALGIEAVAADCADPAALAPHLRRADGLVHVAGILLGSGVAAAGLGDLGRVVVMSTAGIYSRSRTSVDLYRRNEDALRAAHPGVLFVRPTMIYGSPRDRNVHRVIAWVRRFRALPLPSGGTSLLQPIHYADLARVTAILVDRHATGVVDAGGPSPITVRHAAEAIFAALGLPPILVPVPIGAALPVARLADLLAGGRWAERIERLREDRVVGDRRLRELTGERLRTFEEGVRDEVAEMEAHA